MPPKKRTTTKKNIVDSVIEAPSKSTSGRSYLILVLIIAMGLSAAYLLIKGSNVNRNPAQIEEKGGITDEQKAPERSLIEKVARHIMVNEQEEPFVATINNLESVRQKNPQFYKNAHNGDRLLIWSDKAILYSEEKDVLVAVAMALSDGEAGTQQDMFMEDEQPENTMEEQENVTIEIRNGSRIAGEAGRLRASLAAQDVDVVRIGDAAAIYDGSLIIDTTEGKVPSTLSAIFEAIEGTVTSTLPVREPETEADILILIGR